MLIGLLRHYLPPYGWPIAAVSVLLRDVAYIWRTGAVMLGVTPRAEASAACR